MSTFIELEIHALLNEYSDAGLAADRLIQNLEASPENLSAENVDGLARFLWHCGFYSTLHDFVIRHIAEENFPTPWAYFAETLVKIHPDLSEMVIESLSEGIKETKAQEIIAPSTALDKLIPEIGEWRRDRKYRLHKEYQKNKKNYLDQLVTLRTQQLYEQEKELLTRLQKLYPGDPDVQKELKDHQQRYALEILARRTPLTRSHTIEETPLDDEQQQALQIIFAAMLEEVQQDETLAYDFAVALWMMEGYEQALGLLSYAPDDQRRHWFRMELLLKSRRFLELLNELAQMEMIYADEPETFFATAYLRAQAMWGIGQKHTAVEIIESLLISRPHYRSAPSLLAVWSGQ